MKSTKEKEKVLMKTLVCAESCTYRRANICAQFCPRFLFFLCFIIIMFITIIINKTIIIINYMTIPIPTTRTLLNSPLLRRKRAPEPNLLVESSEEEELPETLSLRHRLLQVSTHRRLSYKLVSLFQRICYHFTFFLSSVLGGITNPRLFWSLIRT